jgi:hypothetical protein
MATKFIESGTDATQGFQFWASTTTSDNGAVTSDSSVVRTGPRSIKTDAGTPVAGQAYVQSPEGVLADAGRRISFGFRAASFSLLGNGYFLTVREADPHEVRFYLGQASGGALKLYDGGGTLLATGSSGLSAATWYRITFSYTVTSSTVNQFRVYLDDSTTATLTASNVTISGIGSSKFELGIQETGLTLSTIYNFDDIYVDDGTTLDNISTSDLRVTVKLPATENTTSFDTAIGAARGASDFNNVNERPLSETNGWQHAAITDVQENYGLQAASAGDVDVSAKTLIARMAYVWAKRGAAALTSSTLDTNARITGSTSPLTASFDPGANAKLMVLGIVVGGSTARAGGAPTFNSVAMQQAGSRQTATETNVELWYLINPATTNQTVSIPNTGSLSLFCEVSTYKLPTGATAFAFDSGTIQQGTGVSANPSQTITLSQGGGHIVVQVLGDGLTSVPTDNSANLLRKTDDGNFTDSHQYNVQSSSPPTGVAVSWTIASDDWAMITAGFIADIDTWSFGSPDIMDDGTETAIVLASTSALYTKITDSASYPSNAAGIGMRSAGLFTPDTFFYEGGTLIAYKDAVADTLFAQAML